MLAVSLRICLIVGLLMQNTVALAQSDGIDASLRARIDRIVQPYLDARDFMGVIGIGRPGAEPLIIPYGLASVELSTNHSRSSIFMIGSISKQFTAAAILLLEEDGVLKTSDLLSTHLPDFPNADQVTIEQLLIHSAGIADIYSLPVFGETAGLSGEFADIVKKLGQAEFTHPPGTQYSYSNGGYVLLAAVIESAAGMPYGDFLKERIFDRLAMHDTLHSGPSKTRKNRAYGYSPWGTHELSPEYPLAAAFSTGPGSIWSTALDMLVWTDALHTGRILTPNSYSRIVRDYGNGYGYGISVFSRLGRKTIGHDGRVFGFASDLARYVDDRTTVVVLSNIESVARDEIRYQVAAEVFGEKYTLPRARTYRDVNLDKRALVGVYSFGPDFRVRISLLNDRLLAKANEGADSELVYTDEGQWFSRMLYANVCFEEDNAGVVDKLNWGCGVGAPIGRRLDN